MLVETKDGLFKGEFGGAVPLELDEKTISEHGEFEGYAAVYGNRDLGNDVIEPGAFDESLKTYPAGEVKMLWQHDTHKPIGVWTSFKSDSKGLLARGKLLLSTSNGRDAYEFMKAGAINSLSIGYRTREFRIDRENEVRIIESAWLREVSPVTFPMNPEARIGAVKGELPPKRELETWLMRDAGLTALQAKTLLARGYNAIHDARDAGTDVAGGEDVLTALKGLRETIGTA